MRPLTDRQHAALARIKKNGGREYLSPDIVKQLAKRGIVVITGNKRQRTEWNRPVVGSTLWEVRLVTNA